MRRINRFTTLTLACCFAAAAAPALAGPADRAFQLRVGGFFPTADSEQWATNESLFTLDKSDFNDGALGLSYVVGVGDSLEVGLNADFYEAVALSADRDYVDDFGNQIFHDTRLSAVPLTVDFRLLPGGRFRSRGSRAALKPVLYLGGGIGITYWEYEEVGDFVDATDPADPLIFPWRYVDSGADLQLHALAGVELPVNRNFNVLVEGRYRWAEINPDESYAREFVGTDELDIGGASVFVGGSWRF